MKLDPEKEIECYVGANFSSWWNQEEINDPGLVLYRTGYGISYTKCPIIWVSRLQIEITISNTEAEYIASYPATRDALPFVSFMKEIQFVLKLQGDDPKVLCSMFENPVTDHEDNQGSVALVVAPQMRLCTEHIIINYHHFRSFVANSDIEIQDIDTKEQIADVFTKPLDSELSVYLYYKLSSW